MLLCHLVFGAFILLVGRKVHKARAMAGFVLRVIFRSNPVSINVRIPANR